MFRTACVVSTVMVCLCMTAAPAAAQPVQPALPQVFLDTTYPTQPGTTITVNSGGDVQAAINSANPGDTIVLQAGATFTPTTSFKLKAKTNPNHLWIVIRSSSTMFDTNGQVPPGTRVDGTDATQTGQMAKLRASGVNPVITTDQSSGTLIAGYYRLVGLDIGAPSGASSNTNLILIGSDTETVAANQPSFITVDRCFVHGNDTGDFRRGAALNGSSLAVIDSYFSNFHDINTDAQASGSWNGPGPFKIANNYLEAATENVLFGGSDPKIANLVPSDIEIRRNFMTKNLAKRGATGYTVKNVFELKNAQRVLLDGNVLEYSWEDGQTGYIVVLTPRNQGGNCSWCVVRDVTITNNLMRHGTGLLNLMAFDDTHPSGQIQRVALRNNYSDDINTSWFEPGSANSIKYIQLRGGGSPQSSVGATDLTFDHNTFIFTASHMMVFGDPKTGGGFQTISGFQFTKNLMERKSGANAAYGIEGVGVSSPGKAAMDAYIPGGYTFTNNGIGNVTASQYPTGNQYPDLATWEAQFANYNGGVGGDYHLNASNIYASAGNGDVGVDFAALSCAMDPSTCSGLLTDDFNDNSISVKWSPGVPLTGTTVDTTIAVTETNQRLEIGPLHQNQTGVSYNGMRSANTYDFTNAAVYVQVVVPPNPGNIEEHAMLGAGKDSGNYYRIRISGNTTVAEKRLANGTKVTLATTAYDSTNHQFLRIRHDQASGSVVFETAPASGGVPGTWTTLVSDTWDTTNVPLSAVAFELKAGTTDPQPQPPGTIAFDNFSAMRQ